MTSKTRMLHLIRHLRWQEIAEAIHEDESVLEIRDEDGRNWLHRCCAIDVAKRGLAIDDSLRTADVLIDGGLDINGAAAEQGTWRAIPLWYAIAHGNNVALARHLLERGSEPDHCLWAAVNQNNPEAIRLLVEAGADDPSNEEESPLLAAVEWNKPAAAEELLKLGADPNYMARGGVTPLLRALQKRRDVSFARMLVRHGARGDLPDETGVTAIDVLRRKRDPAFRALLDEIKGGGR